MWYTYITSCYYIYSSTFPLLISSLWALVFWSLSFLIRVKVVLDINSFPWFTSIYYSTFSLLISSLWDLVFWSLSLLKNIKALLTINSFPCFAIYSSTFPLFISSLWALVSWSLSSLWGSKLLKTLTAFLGLQSTLQLFPFSFPVSGLWSLGHCFYIYQQLSLIYYLLFNFSPFHLQSLGFGLFTWEYWWMECNLNSKM